ncbi:MAG: L-threonylcarbamoyladenylate synthase [Lentimicrobium sp.]|nr:L-threonylcarbamoyladenylate synthase [Lentimicrobium sp.]
MTPDIIDIEIQQSLRILRKGGVILYPTDTVWGLGCDALNAKAIEKIYQIKDRPENKSLIILLSNFDELAKYVAEVPPFVEDLIDGMEGPVTVIYEKAKNLPKSIVAADGTIAIRVVKDEFCQRLIQELGKPLISSSANVSGDPTPLVFSQISLKIKDRVDYVVQLAHQQFNQPKASTIIRVFSDGTYQIVRR